MAKKYYLDVEGLKALITKIVANDNKLAVKAGDVITVGTSTSTGTPLSVTTGNGLTKTGTNSDTLAVNKGNGLDFSSGALVVKPKTNGGITVDSNGVSLTTGASGINLKKLNTAATGYASSYELQLNGTTVGDTINIPKDQFLKDVSYVTTAPNPAEGNSASVTFPALRFEWELDTDDETSGEQTITYVSIASLGAVGAISTNRPNANSDSVISVDTAGLMNTDMVSTLTGWTNARITEDIDKLDNTDSATTGKVVDYVSTDNGIASPHKTYLTDVAITDYSKTSDNGALAATDTLEVALSKLENAIAGKQASGNYKTTQTAVADHTTATAADNDLVVVATTQNTNGVVTVTKNTVGAMLLTGYSAKSGATTGDVAATDSINAAIKKVEEKADSAINSAGVTSAAPASNSYITVSGTGSGSAKTGAVTIGATTQAIASASSNSDGLATANDVKTTLEGYKTVQTAVTDGSTATASDTDLVVTAVTQNTNGVVTVTKNTVGKMKMTGYTTENISGDVAATDDVNTAVAKVENKADAIADNISGTIYTIPTQYVNDAFDAAVAGNSYPNIEAQTTGGENQYQLEPTIQRSDIDITQAQPGGQTHP